ncbi:hypothetical protein RA8P2_00117 (plasmid) [Variovorax sp. RA8]|nr:hypothetical protein RA8P2_00117 [Variovorax sp. RA8]
MLAQNGYTHVRRLGETFVGLLQLNCTVGLVVGLTWEGHDRRYCYESAKYALVALEAWDGQGHPGGPWIKCKGAGIDLLNPSFGIEEDPVQARGRSSLKSPLIGR